MALKPAPLRTEISDTYPNPNNGVARTGVGKLWDFVTSLLGITGATTDMLAASKILDPSAIYNLSLVPSVAGSALTMTLKSNDGATALAVDNAATVTQRNATLATGTVLVRNITANIVTVISSGSTAGHISAVLSPIYWYLIDNSGTIELAWSTTNFGIKGIVTTTAEGGAGAADSATIMYSTTARTSVPFRRIGRTFDTQATAGTWASLPTTVEMEPLDVGPASTIQVGQSLPKRKVADESVISSTTLQNDDDLSFPIAAGEEWQAEFYIDCGINVTSTGVKVAVNAPAGATINVSVNFANTDAVGQGKADRTATVGAGVGYTPASGSNMHLVVSCWVLNGATAGTINLQWAQNSNVATNLTFRKGSHMLATRIA